MTELKVDKNAPRQVVRMLVENQPNVLARISSLFGRRNFNISTITASETHIPGVTRITVVTGESDENVLHQIISQTEKLEVVKEIYLLDMKNSVYRELLLLKLKADKTNRAAIREIVEIYRGKIIDLSKSSMIIELTGSPEKLDGFMNMMDCYDIIEVCRTGITGIERGLQE
ncbi:acetolactate synthase small subunit [Anaerotignum lactatifermentans]|uniref:Acetolactate synthase small subunit n=1 Tax=Anaerotignum lactatifermentans TaxID=160404 RepID=A0ABS2G5F1_9FIRM|nr:acetolactate synthase small subunit [Anaerotignum lactatifermentans]MBM6828176.1 acetolactate synthase small subunit [Anaerotignum lactatifermentans]MBM6876661.1 acetolactate synthase small subunit [Anaerotignum lactatifermentans]MBM6949759.1 acetolactate synthase small subunit [Anaerotignum lactatifermentans]